MLIEIFHGVENKTFLKDLFKVIESISPYFVGVVDLWQNDEVLYKVSSDVGDFIISKDV